MSLNWTRENTQNRSTFGQVAFENVITYFVSTPDSAGSGTVVSLNADKTGLLLRTVFDANGVKRANGNEGIELYNVNYVFEATPDANGEASFSVDVGDNTNFLAAQKITTVANQKLVVSGTHTVQSAGDGNIFSITARHSSGCNYEVNRWNITICKVGNRL